MITLKCKTRDGASIDVLYFPSDTHGAPLIFEIHGGGYYGGAATDNANLCQALSRECDANVASVDYRRFPVATFPTATNDCADALDFLIDNNDLDFDRGRIYAMGHSAGANAAAVLSLERGRLLAGQILNYPWLDVRSVKRPSRYFFALPRFMLDYMARKYFVTKANMALPTASPILATGEQLSEMPKSLITVCGNDSLEIDGLTFEKKLTEARINVKTVKFDRAVHGFIEMYFAGNLKQKNKWLTDDDVEMHARYCDEFISHVKVFVK